VPPRADLGRDSWEDRLPPSLERELGAPPEKRARCSLVQREDKPDANGLWRDADGDFCDGCAGRAPRVLGKCTCGYEEGWPESEDEEDG
jgi:hypothetical protein